MEEAELLRALEPVREYFPGKEITVYTVLAAHLRSRGVAVTGAPWEVAKRAIRGGANLADAIQAAVTTFEEGGTCTEVTAAERQTPFVGGALGWFAKPFGPGDIDGEGALRLLGTPNIDLASVLVRETAQNSWDARGVSPKVDFIVNLRRLDGSMVEVLRNRIFTGSPPNIGLTDVLQRDEVWVLEISDRGTVGLNGPIRNDLAVDPGMDTNFMDLVFNIGTPRDVHLGGGTYGFGKTIAYLASNVGAVLLWTRCMGAQGLEHRLIGSAIGDSFSKDGLRFTGRHWWGNVISEESRVEPVTGKIAEELAAKAFAARFGGSATGTSILILDPHLGGESPEDDIKLLSDAVVWHLWPKLLEDQDGRSSMAISVQLNGRPVTLPSIERHPVLGGHAQCLLAVRATQANTSMPKLRYPMEIQEIWCERPRTLLGHIALTRYPIPRGVDAPSHSVTLMRHQAELVVKSLERRQLEVAGFQWAGVFKPAAAVDDSFALAEPPAHDDWIPSSMKDAARKREVNVALKRIKEAADQFLAPRRSSGTDSRPAVSAAIVGDMLADLVAGLPGSGSSLIAAPSSRQGMRPASSDGFPSPSSPTDPIKPNSAVPNGATGESSVPAAPVSPPPPILTDGEIMPGWGSAVGQGADTNSSGPMVVPPAGARASGNSGQGVQGSSGGVRRRVSRPRFDVIGMRYEPVAASGWTRTTIDVRLTEGPTTGALADVSVQVGVDGGSLKDESMEAIRVIGWARDANGTYDSRPQAFTVGAVHQFVYEARSELAIDLEAKADEG
jgi:hypothetical protein